MRYALWIVGMLMVILGGFVVNGVKSDQTAIISRECPQECVCYRGLTTIKCRESSLHDLPHIAKNFATQVEVLDMTGSQLRELKSTALARFPNLKRLILQKNKITNIDSTALEDITTLTDLDLSYNKLKSLPREMFSKSKLKVLYLENNPFSCNQTRLQPLLEEVHDLMSKSSNLEEFDGERLKCADPPNMKGQKIIDLRVTELYKSAIGNGFIYIGLASAATGLLTSLLGAVLMLIKRLKSHGKYVYDSLSSMEEANLEQNQVENVPNVENNRALAHRLQKLRRQSQGYPTHDIIESEDEEAVEPEKYIKDKMKEQRRHSMGYSKDTDSDEMEDVDFCST